MGLLDDAIREHLDLKRRSGGDPAEIERLEREALGPVRREPTAVAGVAEAPPVGAAFESDYDFGDSSDELDDVPRAEIVRPDTQREPKRRGFLRRRPSSPRASESSADDEHDHSTYDAREPLDHLEPSYAEHEIEPEPPHLALGGRHAEEPHGATAEPAHTPGATMDDATVEHQVVPSLDDSDRSRAPESEPVVAGDDDVLEETPEFLQDTPDHDRLWFEQRPPKDFDFDG